MSPATRLCGAQWKLRPNALGNDTFYVGVHEYQEAWLKLSESHLSAKNKTLKSIVKYGKMPLERIIGVRWAGKEVVVRFGGPHAQEWRLTKINAPTCTLEHWYSSLRTAVREQLMVQQQEQLAAAEDYVKAQLGDSTPDITISLKDRILKLKQQVQFPGGSSSFSDPAKAQAVLAQVAVALKMANSVLVTYGASPIKLCAEGHTDADNMPLSEGRAESCAKLVQQELIKIGDAASAKLVTSKGFSNTKPHADPSLSRRVEMVVVADY